MGTDDVRKIEYQVMDENGTLVDATEPGNPIEVGPEDDDLLPAVAEAIDSLEPGDEARLTLKPDDAFGDRDPEAIGILPMDRFPDGTPSVGDVYSMETEEGEILQFGVVSIEADGVKADFNHPLAGRSLTIVVKRVD